MKYLYCYRCYSDLYEEVWTYVQSHAGFMSIRSDCIDFWVHERYASFILLIDSSLKRIDHLDYIV